MEKLFYIFCHEDENWIYFDSFLDYLKKYHVDIDKQRTIVHGNVIRILKSYSHAPKDIDGRTSVPLISILRYIFHNVDNLQSCKDIAKNFSKKICTPTAYHNTILSIYEEIAKTDLAFDEVLENISCQNLEIDTLYQDYKGKFSEKEWKKICMFEKQFSERAGVYKTFEESATQRWDLVQSIKKCREMGCMLVKDAEKCIASRQKRQEVTQKFNRVHLKASQKHLACKLDEELLIKVTKYFPTICETICVDMEESEKYNSLLVFTKLKGQRKLNAKEQVDLANCIEMILSQSHRVHCFNLVILKNVVFDSFTENGQVSRFLLRDAFLKKKLANDTVAVVQHNVIGCEETTNQEVFCHDCFPDMGSFKPHGKFLFNIFDEWSLDVPLQIQSILGPMINRDSLSQACDKKSYLQKKLEKLYLVYDILLNTHNKKFTGLLQLANTEELLMGYKSISTVFKITSHSGISTSLTHAEKDLKEKSRKDDCYYNTFLKHHTLTYHTAAGIDSHEVSMRDCFCILMLDNLVRLKYRSDPDPGESRSKQMCTLPVTLQGLPKDNVEIETWHDVSICDGSDQCACKKPIDLQTKDINLVLLQLSEEEESAYDKFSKLCTWGNSFLWNSIQTSELWDKITDEINKIEEKAGQTIDLHNDKEPVGEFENESDEDEEHNDVLKPEDNLHDLLEAVKETGYLEEVDNSQIGDIPFELFDGDISYMEVSEIHGAIKDAGKTHSLETSFHNLDLNSKHTEVEENNEFKENRTGESENEEVESQDIKDGNVEENKDGKLRENKVDLEVGELEEIIDDEIEANNDESFQENQDAVESPPLPVKIGLNKYTVPPLLYLHPPPYEGRDDDIMKLREVLDDISTKLGYYGADKSQYDKIIFGPDNKIGSNLIRLVRESKEYDMFLPEFPCLHMRKSKINNIFSAYKSCGIIQMLQYMKDDATKDWSKLLTSEHIETATKNIRRLSQSLHTLFLVKFIGSLPPREAELLVNQLQHDPVDLLARKWHTKYTSFITEYSQSNATFALHRDIMLQLDEVLAVALAERLGGKDGYNLLLAVAKKGITFGFLNGAISYAPYCVQLVYEHYRAGPFYRNMKMALFSTPLKASNANFATDTKRELDHIDVMRGFRSGSTINTVTRRMSMIDKLSVTNSFTKECPVAPKQDNLGWTTSETDMKHIIPLITLLLRRSGLSSCPELFPYNMYLPKKGILSQDILNDNSKDVGRYLLLKYLAKEGLFHLESNQIPNPATLDGPKALIAKVKRSKGVTIKRASANINILQKTERQCREEKRKKVVASQTKRVECLSSDMNMVQALVKPDCSKPKVQKSRGMLVAITEFLCNYPEKASHEHMLKTLEEKKLMFMGRKSIPSEIGSTIRLMTLEFAGVKFKTTAISGNQYIKHIENSLLKPFLRQAPNIKEIVLCEEKYSFTPDDFKAATRNQRIQKTSSISHLKTGKDMISSEKFHKDSLITTQEGKSLISTYLAANISRLEILQPLSLIIDSEFKTEGCVCKETDKTTCNCHKFSTPLRCQFDLTGLVKSEFLSDIQQRKGEAEMSQVDWLIQNSESLSTNEAAASLVTSGDIDALVIHLLAISKFWRRNSDGKFISPVYVILQKPCKKLDIFNITSILEFIEGKYQTNHIGQVVSYSLCVGGNDFIPKLHGKSHSKILKCIMQKKELQQDLFQTAGNKDHICTEKFLDLIKLLYCPKTKDCEKLTYEEIRQSTIQKRQRKKESADGNVVLNTQYRNPQQWMPPASAMIICSQLVDLQIEYLNTVGNHAADLPNFLGKECLIKRNSGEIEYNFGHESFMAEPEPLASVSPLTSTPVKGKKRLAAETPQKGLRRKALQLKH